MVVDTNQHGPLDYTHQRFKFLRNTCLHGVDIMEGQIATLGAFTYDTNRQSVLVDLDFGEDANIINIPVSSLIREAEGIFEEEKNEEQPTEYVQT